MSRQTIQMTDRLYAYLLDVSLREPEVMRRLREETALHPQANLQIAPDQGQLMALLVEMLGATKALEVGVFTGYSALAVALAMPPGGRLVACDINEEFTSVARRYWREAGVEGRIELRLAPALETLDTLLAERQGGTFDFAFIDADKRAYAEYYERVLRLLRPGGVLAVDNVLRDGRVADPAVDDEETRVVRAFNESLHRDERVTISLVPIADGLTLARKR